VVCVEMEAAALYAYAAARQRDVVCFAHITNTMALAGNDFEKGESNGADAALQIAAAMTSSGWWGRLCAPFCPRSTKATGDRPLYCTWVSAHPSRPQCPGRAPRHPGPDQDAG